ncbi:MAG: hypothetical protein NTV34_20565 [Proteobacteria bacterium]|nr:hypothetical protein [Pseudomonadota bacterium]
MNFFGKNISFVLPHKSKTIILDKCNEEFVRQMAGDNSIPSIATRGELYYVNPIELAIGLAMFTRCLYLSKSLREVGISRREQVTIARLASRIWLYAPRTVLTFIDNNKGFSALHVFFKGKISFAALVNGARGISSYDISYKFRYDVLFTHGDMEGRLAAKYGHQFIRVIPIGSPKLLLFLRDRPEIIQLKDTSLGLCLISQYRIGMEDWDQLVDLFTPLAQCLARFCISTNRAITVLGRTNTEAELAYIQQIFAGVVLNFIPNNPESPFSSYSNGMRAEVLLTPDSTLGQELLGVGKKVMFASCTDKREHDATTGDYKYILRTSSFEDFASMLEELIAYPYETFAKDFEMERKILCRSDVGGIKIFENWLSQQ